MPPPPSADPEQKLWGAWKGVVGCLWVFLLAFVGLLAGGRAGFIIDAPVREGSGEWRGLGAGMRKLDEAVLGAFVGAAIGAAVGCVVVAVTALLTRLGQQVDKVAGQSIESVGEDP